MAEKFKNRSLAALSAGIDNSVTALSVISGAGAKFLDPASDGNYYGQIFDGAYGTPALDPDAEWVLITARSTDSFTITRAQKGDTAKSHNTAGQTYYLMCGPSAEVINAFVTGPASATDLAIAIYDGTTGKLLKNSLVTIDANGSVNIPAGQAYKINGASLAAADVGLGTTSTPQFSQLALGRAIVGTNSLTLNGSVWINAAQEINWAGGNAAIAESSYSLLFKTYTGAALTTKMTIPGTGDISLTVGLNIPAGQTYKINNVALAAADVGAVPSAYLDTDGALAANSDSKVATQKAVKTYADTKMTNPMSAAGDIIYGGASGTPTRLAKGTAGQVLKMNTGATAPEWGDASGGTTILKAVKTADESVTTSTTYQDDDHLSVTAEANATYIFRMILFVNQSAADGSFLKSQLVVPSGTTLSGIVSYTVDDAIYENITTTPQTSTTFPVKFDYVSSPSTYSAWMRVEGTIITSSTAGAIKLQWAQLSPNGSTTKLLKGSNMTLIKI